jgi:hypothetical protein
MAFCIWLGDKHYYPKGKVTPTSPHRWTFSKIILGSSKADEVGSIFVIHAVLVDNSTDAQIRSFLRTQGGSKGCSEEEWQTSFKRFSVDQTAVERSG